MIMKDLKDIYESILDDEDELVGKTDYMLERPLKWFYEESLKCRNIDDFDKLVRTFENIIVSQKQVYLLKQNPRFQLKTPGYWRPMGSFKMSRNEIYIVIKPNTIKSYPTIQIGRGGYQKYRYGVGLFDGKVDWVEYDGGMSNMAIHTDDKLYVVLNKPQIIKDFEELEE